LRLRHSKAGIDPPSRVLNDQEHYDSHLLFRLSHGLVLMLFFEVESDFRGPDNEQL
jgi:hypothetical protein